MFQSKLHIPLIALVGPPNSGKTTLFNYLSGKNHKTVNYPGSTVEYNSSILQNKFGLKAELLDSPGMVSLIPNSPDESIAIEALYDHPEFGAPSIVIVTADSNQLTRHLILCKQVIQSGFRTILVLTMLDLLNKRGYDIDEVKLGSELKCDVVKIDGRKGTGIPKLINIIKTNLDIIKPDSKRKIEKFEIPADKNYLLKSFAEIEQIEDNVLITNEQNNKQSNIEKANNELVVLNSVKKFPHKIDETTLKIDQYLLHKYWGLFYFFLIMSLTFTSIFWFAQPLMNLVDSFFGYASEAVFLTMGYTWYSDLIANGLIAGLGSVLVFVPQIIILFMVLGLLEDTGYLARGAMLIDKPLSKIGLNGRSFVPMLSGFACAIPAMLATRTIPNRRERLLTIFIIPLMSCSARLPVYALLIAFITPPEKPWLGGIILSSIYIFSIISSVVIAGLINKFRKKIINAEDSSSFILELPTYRLPKGKVVLNNTIISSKLYVQRAGPIIVGFSLILWFLTYFPNTNPHVQSETTSKIQLHQLQSAERLSHSYASELGKLIQPIMTPLGMDWRIGVSLVAAFAAREVFVSSLALIFKVTGDQETIQQSILSAMRSAEIESSGEKLFTLATSIGLIVFFVFAMQCISTVAVSKKETGGWRIPILQILIFTSIAYVFTFAAVNGLRLLGVE
ncbi:MAG TPA: ferrous iron transport protein B [Ignavibacteriaceae bacterium]|nr:ferrous iron transport protein B [Ignavibacteriaceae bacterium]